MWKCNKWPKLDTKWTGVRNRFTSEWCHPRGMFEAITYQELNKYIFSKWISFIQGDYGVGLG